MSNENEPTMDIYEPNKSKEPKEELDFYSRRCAIQDELMRAQTADCKDVMRSRPIFEAQNAEMVMLARRNSDLLVQAVEHGKRQAEAMERIAGVLEIQAMESRR